MTGNMQKKLQNSLIALFIWVLLSGSAFAQVRVSAQVDSSKDIYVGESFGYYIVIEGAEAAGQADMSVLQKYNPQSTGNRQQSSTQIINGRVTTSKYIAMTYSLTAGEAGRIQIPPVTVTIDGKNYQTNPVQVNILKPGTTDSLDLEVELSDKQCYVGQPVIMSVKFYIMSDIGDFNFNIPVFASDDFYLEDPDTSNQQVKQYQLGSGVIVGVSQNRTTHNGRDAILLAFSKVLIPKHSGMINIEPSTVSANVAVGRSSSRNDIFSDFFGSNVQYKRFMVSSKSAQLNVMELPSQGKPNGFYGLVGKYTITSSASPTKVSVGDPITLNVKIGGNRYLKPVQWPLLEQISDFNTNFKIPSEKASPVMDNGSKVFTQTIRANSDTVTEIPSIPLVYFDSEKGEYVTAKTDPIKLEVSPTKILTTSDLQGSDSTPVNKEVEAIKQGLSANYLDMEALKNQDFSPLAAIVSPGYLIIWAGPLAVFLFSGFTRIYRHTTPEKEAQKRKRSAAHKAIAQLKGISSVDSHESIEKLANIMKQYIGERFDRTAGSLTSDDCCQVVANSGSDEQTAKKFREIIAGCEASRYASAGINIGMQQVKEAIDLILTIEKKSGK
jgi:hypothetical protein